jgi:hypothetical protein
MKNQIMAPNTEVRVEGNKLIIEIPDLTKKQGFTNSGNDKICSAQFYIPDEKFGAVKVGINVYEVNKKK